MTDDTIETSDKPIPFPDKQMAAQGQIPTDHGLAEQHFDEQTRSAEAVPAAERLAAAEDRLLGPDVPRHNGKPERGVGSKFHGLHPDHKAHIAAIEHLIAVEAEHAEAEARLTAVHAKVTHALARVEATEEASANVEKEA